MMWYIILCIIKVEDKKKLRNYKKIVSFVPDISAESS